MSITDHFVDGTGANLCKYCGRDPMNPTDPNAMRRNLYIHIAQEHPESPEAREMKANSDRRNAEHQARVNSPSYKAAQAREQEASDRLQPMKYGKLYHGSKDDLPVGTIIRPHPVKKIAFATPSRRTADDFGAKAEGGGHTYEVEHVGPVEDSYVRQMKYTGRETHYEVVSPHGFRVVRKL